VNDQRLPKRPDDRLGARANLQGGRRVRVIQIDPRERRRCTLALIQRMRIDWVMRRITTFWVALVLASTCNVTSALSATSSHPDTAVALASADVAAAALGRENMPGIQIAIIRGGQIVLDQGYGVRDIDARQPVESNTLFEIGSITKSFTSAAILQLKERGKLRLNDRLGQYVPEYPRGKDITIEQLLQMTSGIPDHINDVPNSVKIISASPGNLDAALALIKDMPLNFKPGTQSVYSNTNYLLLGTIVARVSKTPYDEYISKNIFAPAGMTHSAFLKDEPSLPHMAVGYALAAATKLKVAGHIGYGWSGGAGSIVSTAGDLAQWDNAFFSGRIISAADVKLATTPLYINGKSTTYGLGWSIDQIEGIPVISHDGGMLGFTSINDVFPTIGLSIIVLTNNGATPPDSVAKDILAKLDPEFAKKRAIAAAGENFQITAKTEKVWTELHIGTIDRSELTPDLEKALTPDRVAFMHAHYARAGTPLWWIYKGKQEWPDGSTTYSYRVLFKNGLAVLVAATIAKNGKFANVDTQYD
jgi:D-alanyl-D-alanine carboxypeptidase